MKNRILLATILLFIFSGTYGQNSKHQVSSGKVIFDISYPESQLDDNTKASLPTESIMYFKNDMAKVEVSMPMGKTIMISDNKSGDGTMLMDMMGKKWAIKTSKADIQKQKESLGKPKVELTRETKTIAGYSCSKAVVTISTKRGDKSFDVWYTNELKARNSFSSQIEGVDGFLMEFNNNQNGMSMKMTARSVEVKDIPDSEFAIPTDYTVTTMDEMRKSMGGGK